MDDKDDGCHDFSFLNVEFLRLSEKASFFTLFFHLHQDSLVLHFLS